MGELLSLKLHRKRKVRALKENDAAANRAKFGRAKDERTLTRSKHDLENKRLEDHKLEE